MHSYPHIKRKGTTLFRLQQIPVLQIPVCRFQYQVQRCDKSNAKIPFCRPQYYVYVSLKYTGILHPPIYQKQIQYICAYPHDRENSCYRKFKSAYRIMKYYSKTRAFMLFSLSILSTALLLSYKKEDKKTAEREVEQTTLQRSEANHKRLTSRPNTVGLVANSWSLSRKAERRCSIKR